MRSSEIGGQAVIEGVMMKNRDRYAVAVRKPDGEITVDVQKIEKKRTGILKAPIIRGVVAFVDSMVVGIKTLSYSATFFEEEETEKKAVSENKESAEAEVAVADAEKAGAEAELTITEENASSEIKKDGKKDDKQSAGDKALIAGTVVLSIAFSVVLFMLLPMFLSRFLAKVIESQLLLTLVEGALRLLIFIGYVVAISQLNDIKRVFAYHGAEHKSINCIENGLDLTVENVRTQSRQHKRCGTSFLLFVVFISLIFFLFIRVEQVWLQAVIRVLLVPVIAGISYEIIRFAGNSENKVIVAISKPGFALQKLTTREPDDSMIEVAIASVEAVYDWKPFVEKVRKEQAAAERLAAKNAAKAEEAAKRKAELKAAAEKKAAELEALEQKKAEEQRAIAAKEAEEKRQEAEKLAEEKKIRDAAIAEERRAKAAEEAERKAAEKAERVAAKEAEKAAKAEASRLAAEEAARKAAEEAEAARLEAEAAAKAEEERKKALEVNLDALDKVLTVSEEEKGKELVFKDPYEDRKLNVIPVEEEEDEILKALDRYFVMNDEDDT